ncbi:MAG: zinc metallopeptidase [Chloroflexi bacterium]|nr:zinc metallopeptidase [Chloroflexota bacterium]
MFYDPLYLCLMAPAFLLMLLAQWYVSSAYRRWSRVPLSTQMTGAEVAEYLARRAGLQVRIVPVQGFLSDHYDPRTRTLRLSQKNYYGRSVAAAAVSAHELGHALQHATEYKPLALRSALVPVVNIGSYLGWVFLMLGLVLRWANLIWLGVGIFSLGVIFTLITLPVEFNASARAKQLLRQTGIVRTAEEVKGVNQVLNAAALTYVASFVNAAVQLLYYVLLASSLGRRRS